MVKGRASINFCMHYKSIYFLAFITAEIHAINIYLNRNSEY